MRALVVGAVAAAVPGAAAGFSGQEEPHYGVPLPIVDERDDRVPAETAEDENADDESRPPADESESAGEPVPPGGD